MIRFKLFYYLVLLSSLPDHEQDHHPPLRRPRRLLRTEVNYDTFSKKETETAHIFAASAQRTAVWISFSKRRRMRRI